MTATEFVTDDAVVVPAITTAQMREVDRVAIEEVGPNLFQMMENAGRNLALAAIEMLGERWETGRLIVLAGTGGNGGGGICAARHLANRGLPVTVVIADEDSLTEVPAEQLRIFRGTDGVTATVGDLAHLEVDLVIDAVIGYSLGGVPRGAARNMIGWTEAVSAPVLSLDVPSGLNSTTGQSPGAVVRAAATMTLALPKSGLDAPVVGSLTLADIGIPAAVYARAGIRIPPGIFGSRYRVPLSLR